MPLNSVNTNTSAMVALQSLNRTTDALDVTQKRVSTGFRVADAKDDGAAFAVAQSVRADVAGLTSANEQLGGIKGILDTSLASLNRVSNAMSEIRSVLVKLADGNLADDTRTQYEEQYVALRTKAENFFADATYNGKKLLGAPADATDISTVRNESGTTYTVAATDNAGLLMDAAAPTDAAAAQALLADAGGFDTVMSAVNSALNQYGSDSKYVEAQITYNKEKLDSMESGLGALIDADLAKESARLQALQIRQQLGTQALGIANQAPQSLLSLFRG